jgi:hypothetical protein
MNVMCACLLIIELSCFACGGMLRLTLFILQNEMMSDSIDSILDDDQAEEEIEELANQVISDDCFKRELFVCFKCFFLSCFFHRLYARFFLLLILFLVIVFLGSG